jgi:HK97 family phage major capsid protein
MQWDIKALREKMADVAAKCEAIFEIAKAENRDLTAEESAEVDKLQGTSDKPGEIQALQSQIARAERFDAIKAANVVAKLGGELPRKREVEDSDLRPKIPKAIKRQTKLTAFEDDEQAYIAGQFYLAALVGNKKSEKWLSDNGIQMIHSTEDNGKGGYLVPDILENTLIDLKENYGTFRQYSMQWPMTSDTSQVPRRVGGFTTYFPGEGNDVSLSDMAFDQVKLSAKLMGVATRVTGSLNEDSIISLGDIVTREFARALALQEDECGWNGDGTSTYGGMSGLKTVLAAGSIVTATGVTTFGNVTMAHFEDMVGLVPEFSGISPAWYFHKRAYYATAGRLQNAAGGNNIADLGRGPELVFQGYPVRFIEVMPKTASSAAIIGYLGDLAMTATMGNRRGISIRSDSSLGFLSDTIYIRGLQRVDINVHERGNATDAGPMVALKLG